MSNNDKLINKFKSFKEILGMGEGEDTSENTGIIDIDIQKNAEEETKQTEATPSLFKKSKQEKKVKEKEREKAVDTSGYQSVIIEPKRFEDCKKIANYIKDDKTVTLNLEHLDTETAQRIIDFLSGAMSIKEAKLIEISKNVYVSVPKNINVFFDGENDRKEKSFLKI
ncbi:cell division protein SepF [Fusobacterium sp.]|uniref:cell division protein SepF n=1 Tax=Fusobacterium sp. TaxID=68766 RepID=UPI00262440CD|nr:cell division protein SepF [Fusobacterium sp.]